MNHQLELRAVIEDALADPLEDYFCEIETPYWGVMQKERGDPLRSLRVLPGRSHGNA
jgi:hypothetical protein